MDRGGVIQHKIILLALFSIFETLFHMRCLENCFLFKYSYVVSPSVVQMYHSLTAPLYETSIWSAFVRLLLNGF